MRQIATTSRFVCTAAATSRFVCTAAATSRFVCTAAATSRCDKTLVRCTQANLEEGKGDLVQIKRLSK